MFMGAEPYGMHCPFEQYVSSSQSALVTHAACGGRHTP